MILPVRSAFAPLVLVPALASACSASGAADAPSPPATDAATTDVAPPAPGTGTVVFGVTGDLRPGVDVDRLRVVRLVDGQIVDDRTVASPALAWPLEVPVRDAPDGAAVSVRLEAFVPGAPSPLVTRLAATRAVAGRSLVVRVALQSICAPPLVGQAGTKGGTPADGGAGDAGGPITGWLACVGGETCIDGTCAPSDVDPSTLDEYTPDWNRDRPDPPCKPVLGAPPALVLGEGQSDFASVAPGQMLQVEAGPQGGHHVWVAVRMRNLHGAGTRTRLTAQQPGTGTTIAPYDVIFGYDPDEGGWCKLYGLRFQLDANGVPLAPLLGQPLTITAEAIDSAGDRATATQTVTLSASSL